MLASLNCIFYQDRVAMSVVLVMPNRLEVVNQIHCKSKKHERGIKGENNYSVLRCIGSVPLARRGERGQFLLSFTRNQTDVAPDG